MNITVEIRDIRLPDHCVTEEDALDWVAENIPVCGEWEAQVHVMEEEPTVSHTPIPEEDDDHA